MCTVNHIASLQNAYKHQILKTSLPKRDSPDHTLMFCHMNYHIRLLNVHFKCITVNWKRIMYAWLPSVDFQRVFIIMRPFVNILAKCIKLIYSTNHKWLSSSLPVNTI